MSVVSNNLLGVLWALMATALFASTAAMGKVAVADYHVLQILFVRQSVVFLSAVPILVRSFPGSLYTRNPGWHAARLAGAFVALSCVFWAVKVLPLSTAIAVAFSQVLFVSLLATLVLGERASRRRWFAVLCGFIGVLIVMRPSPSGLANWLVVIPLLGGFGAAVALICVRHLSQTESTATLLIYQAVLIGFLAGIPLPWLWKTPDASGWILLLGIAGLSTIAQWLGVRALRLGEASIIGSIEYTKLIYAAIIGYVVFQEVPDGYTVAGALIIVLSGVAIVRSKSLPVKRSWP